MHRLYLLLLVGNFILAAQVGHGQEKGAFSRADLDFFESKVRPILSARCFSCHSTETKKTRGGLALNTRAALLEGGDHGPAVVPGNPAESRIIEAIRYRDAKLSMPPAGKLPDREAALLIEWVRRGAPYSQEGSKSTRTGINLAEGRKFWSFQPFREQPLPQVKQKDWPRKPIDHFLLAELEKQGLTPSAQAPRRVLIRRAYFDLHGLPPTPEEVDAFEKDTSANAYEKLIDRLFASPHYGERWGRYWLDLARYCDVPEPWAETKGQPHLYRDWVVHAINSDAPYDRFIAWQLAADLMPDASPKDVAALGFLGLSPTYWKELKLDPTVIKGVVAEEWEERIQAVTGTFLGLTVACARCHDHKFDPITTEDYYALAGIFASSKPADRYLVSADRAADITRAKTQLQSLEGQLGKLKAAKTSEDDAKVKDLKHQIEAIRKSTPDLNSPLAVAIEDSSLYVLPDGPDKTKLVYKSGEACDVAMQIRGNPASLGKVVPRRFLSVLSPETPITFTKGSGRLELAKAIVHEAAPLTARVFVNRVWKHHFGRGLVETPSDFGVQGDRPTHPDLLDDLAARFIANGWSLRWLHREIMLSAAYQQSSAAAKEKQAIDPDNKYLWRISPRRLDVESWRDSMLAVNGTLDRQVGGASIDLGDAKNHRRTLYGTVKRRELHDLLRLYDFPDPTGHASHRIPTTTPLQQLFALNSPFVQQQAIALSARIKKNAAGTEGRVRLAYRLLFQREPTRRQMEIAEAFLHEGTDARWQQYAQALLTSNEFQFID